jgi:hypothetical protein
MDILKRLAKPKAQQTTEGTEQGRSYCRTAAIGALKRPLLATFLLGLLFPEDRCSMVLQNLGNNQKANGKFFTTGGLQH